MLDQGRMFQSKSSSRADAKEAAAKGPASKQREKGLWNFLTWSFFISHIVAAQQVAAASAMAAEASADDAGRTGAQPADAPIAVGAAAQSDFERADVQQTVAPPTQSLDPGAPTPVVLADQTPAPEHAEAFDDAAAHGVPRGQHTVADLAEKSASSDSAQLLEAPELGHVLDQVLDPVTDVLGGVVHVVDTVVDPLVAPVVGLVGDVVESLDPILDQVVSPVAGLAGSVIELVEPLLDPIIMPTAAVLEEVLQALDPVIDPVTGIAAGATALLGEAIEPVTALVGDVVEPLVPVINDLTAPIGEVISPLLAPLGSVLAPVTAPLLGPIADGISLLDPLTGQGSSPLAVQWSSPSPPCSASNSRRRTHPHRPRRRRGWQPGLARAAGIGRHRRAVLRQQLHRLQPRAADRCERGRPAARCRRCCARHPRLGYREHRSPPAGEWQRGW